MEFNDYWNIEYIPIAVACTVCYSVWSILLCYSICKKGCNTKPLSSVISGFIKFTWLGNLTEEKKQYFLFNYPVEPWFVRIQFFSSISTWLAMFLAFWSTFLVQVTDSCINIYDCFYLNKNNSRIEDCRQVDSSKPLECLYLQLDLIRGAGSAGGVQALMITLQYGQLLLFVWLKKKITRSVSNKWEWKLIAVSVIVNLLVYELVLLQFGIIGIYRLGPRPAGISQTRSFLMFTFLMVSVFFNSISFVVSFLYIYQSESETDITVSSSPCNYMRALESALHLPAMTALHLLIVIALLYPVSLLYV